MVASTHPIRGLPHRGAFGDARPPALDGLALPPAPMPGRMGTRPLKAWRFVGVFGSELMICLAAIRVGPVHQCFWAVWDRRAGRLYERTHRGVAAVRLQRGSAVVAGGELRLALTLEETAGVESICPSGDSYAWTRKQGGVRAHGTLAIGRGSPRPFAARAVIDDTAAYYERHTRWRWSAGVGSAVDGRELAWNLVAGVNDPPRDSERSVWVDGVAHEVGPVSFAADLSSVGGLHFTAEATRRRDENRGLVRSRYRQPFGTFCGELPGPIAIAEGYGVIEDHDAWW
ncbi:MAG: DUF2804 domain-containing protein [Solirubrobacteraceae bacterium]